MSAETVTLPMLREDLHIEKGSSFINGAPSWLIHDPLRNQFFKIGETTFELLSVWKETSLDAFCKLVATRFGRAVKKEEVEETIKFLYSNQLTENPPGDDYNSFLEQEKAKKRGLGSTIIHNYLFFKIPLFNPQTLLDVTWPIVRFLFSKGAIFMLLLLGIVALYLV